MFSPAPGVLIGGRYRLGQPVGRGGMGQVWAATHAITRRSVALKFLPTLTDPGSNLARRLLQEARATAAVDHPNVVEVHDVFDLEGATPVLVMELLEGETLAARLRRKESLPLEDTASLLIPVISAVGTAHTRGIVHRDLKPANIFLTTSPEPQVKVLDFGIAKLTSADVIDGSLTTSGTTLGTPCYMAPEQAMAERDVDHRVDVWAIGVILYECLSGARPVEGENLAQIVMRLMSGSITPIEHVVPGLPRDVADLVGGMLKKRPAERLSDLRGAFAVLSRYSHEKARVFGAPASDSRLEIPEPEPEPPRPEPAGPGSVSAAAVQASRGPNRISAGALGIAAVALIGGVMTAATRGESSSGPSPAGHASTPSPGQQATVQATFLTPAPSPATAPQPSAPAAPARASATPDESVAATARKASAPAAHARTKPLSAGAACQRSQDCTSKLCLAYVCR